MNRQYDTDEEEFGKPNELDLGFREPCSVLLTPRKRKRSIQEDRKDTGNDRFSGNDHYSGLQGPDRFFPLYTSLTVLQYLLTSHEGLTVSDMSDLSRLPLSKGLH